MDANGPVDEPLDVSLLHLLLVLALHMAGNVLPVPVAKHLHSVQQQQVFSIYNIRIYKVNKFLSALNK